MGAIRISQTTGRFCIVQPGFAVQSSPQPRDTPVMSLVNRGGILQRLYGDEMAGDWSVQIFEINSPVVSPDAEPIYHDEPRQCRPSFGYHYIMSATHRCATPLEECRQWSNMLVAIQDRIRWLSEQSGVGYVAVFADMNVCDVSAPSMQIATFQTTPPAILNEARASDAASQERGVCTICQMMGDVSEGQRLVLQTDNFVAFCPWAPSCPYEFWVAPRRHATGFLQASQGDLDDMGMMLRATLGGLRRIWDGGRFGMAFHLSPERKNTRQVHWHVEVYPGAMRPTALEMGFGVVTSNIPPEDAARRLGAAGRDEMAAIMGVE